MPVPFHIDFLDHVAIRVANMERSQQWYERVLGLNKLTTSEWGPVPVFMVKENFGIAIFPADLELEMPDAYSRHVKIDHLAFRVSNQDFIEAQAYFKSIGEQFEFQDHHYFHSIYLRDPDKHKVELTTLIKAIN